MFGVCPFGASTFSSIYTSDCSRGCMRVSVCVCVTHCKMSRSKRNSGAAPADSVTYTHHANHTHTNARFIIQRINKKKAATLSAAALSTLAALLSAV